jgi:hypothetical protein
MSFVIIYSDYGKIIEALSKSFKVKTMGEMSKFVGRHIIDTTDKFGDWNNQPKLLKNLKELIRIQLKRVQEFSKLSSKDLDYTP